MSNDEDIGTLEVASGAGIAFRVLDLDGSEQGRGSGKLELPLSPGVYSVQWLTGGEQSETLVRVMPATKAEASFVPSKALEPVLLAPVTSTAPKIIKELQPSEKNYGSSVSVVVTATEGGNPKEALGTVRLIDARDVVMRSAESETPDVALQHSEVARCYHVRPGRFRLSYVSHTGETMEQSVPAIRGRQTIIFLEATQGNVLIVKGAGLKKVERAGIDPSRTVMVSVKGDESDRRIRERLRLTGLLLRDLAGGGAALTKEFCSIVEKKSVDPLLRLSAAITVLSRLEAGKAPSLDSTLLASDQDREAIKHEWVRRVASWLPKARFGTWPVDAVAAWWQLERVAPWMVPDRLPRGINVPPMYACSWRWATARSASVPDAIERTASLRAAEGGSTSEPWLCWKAAAAKGQATIIPRQDGRTNEALALDVAQKVTSLFGSGEGKANYLDPFSVLPPQEAALALALQQDTESKSRLNQTNSLAENIASALAIPGRTLSQRLMGLDQALEGIALPVSPPEKSMFKDTRVRIAIASKGRAVGYTKSEPAPGMRRSRRSKAPALMLESKVPDDPQKGRFGGASQVGAYALSAMFSPTRSKDWWRVAVTVSGPADEQEEAQFFRHDSFNPVMVIEHFRQGKATHVMTAWGGFTVGLWLPYRKIQLELDLAQLPDAPLKLANR